VDEGGQTLKAHQVMAIALALRVPPLRVLTW
jgi:hypothetical protein